MFLGSCTENLYMDQCNERLHFCFLLIGSKFHIRSFGLLSILRWFLIIMRDSGQVPVFFMWMSIFPAPFVKESILYEMDALGAFVASQLAINFWVPVSVTYAVMLGSVSVVWQYHAVWAILLYSVFKVSWCFGDFFSSLLWYVLFYNFTQMSRFFSSSLKTVIHILERIKIWACRF